MKTLQELRDAIDALDTQILSLLNARAQCANEVGELKKREGSAVFRPDREAQVINKLQTLNDTTAGLLKPHSIGNIWREVMSACRALEAPQRIAYLGPAGTFSQQAALSYFGTSITEIACPSIDEVFRSTASGTADFGVVPIENSTEGVIARSLDLLLQSPVHIIGELSLLVRHHLLRQVCQEPQPLSSVHSRHLPRQSPLLLTTRRLCCDHRRDLIREVHRIQHTRQQLSRQSRIPRETQLQALPLAQRHQSHDY